MVYCFQPRYLVAVPMVISTALKVFINSWYNRAIIDIESVAMAIQYLIDEQINPRVAHELRKNDVEAVSIHELGLSNQKFQDIQILDLALEREETLLTLDDDFLKHHADWMATGKSHYGIVWGHTSKYQTTGAIGVIVRFCTDLDALIEAGAGTLENDIYNQVHYLAE